MAEEDKVQAPVAKATARVPWLVVLFASGGTELLPDQRLLLRQVPMEPEPVDVVLATRYDDVGLSAMLPRELHLLSVDRAQNGLYTQGHKGQGSGARTHPVGLIGRRTLTARTTMPIEASP